ncbi:MAG: hypothetical protein V3V08_07210 [Nannocystaceae bacterium]
MEATLVFGLIKLLDVALLAVEAAPEIIAALTEQRNKLVSMAEQKRDPTALEWDELLIVVQANSAEIQAIRDAANRGA